MKEKGNKDSSGCERLLLLLLQGMETVFELLPNKKEQGDMFVFTGITCKILLAGSTAHCGGRVSAI